MTPLYSIFYPFANAIGMVGVACILLAYLMVSMGKWTANKVTYLLLNLTGACLILFSLFFHWNLSSVMIEIAWIIISLVGILKNLKPSMKKTAEVNLDIF